MDLLTALLACNLYTADEPLVRAIAQSNSHGNPYAVVDPALDYRDVEVPPEPKTLEDAVARMHDIQSKGGHPLLGLMQVRPEWMTAFGREIGQAFGVCPNIAVGSAMLSALDRECAGFTTSPPVLSVHRGRERLPVTEILSPRRACVASRYGEAIGMPDFGLLIRLELGAQRTRVAKMTEGPILFSLPEGPGWGAQAIFALPSGASGGNDGPDGF